MLIATLSIALVAGVRFATLHDISILDAFQAATLDTAQFKATEVPRPTADSEATALAPMVVIVAVSGASLPRGNPMGGVGRARGLLNTSEGKTTLIFLIEYKTINCVVKYFYFQGIHCSLESCQHRCHQGT